MELPFEAAKGTAEKVLMVQFPTLMRVVLPGLLATAVLYRVVAWALSQLPGELPYSWERIALYAALVFVLGALISTLSSEIYKVYEGRTFWPEKAFEWARRRQATRIAKLRRAAESATSPSKYDELWYKLRIYPINDEGDPEATHPTALGNILAGYEQYPGNRYGMDSVFFWPRIWLQIEKDKKEEIDSQWSVADGFLILSAVSFVGAVVWISESVLVSLHLVHGTVLPIESASLTALLGIGWLLLGYAWYRLSLPFHRENGEVFKSIFDLYRNKIWDITCLRPQERETWYATWAYLQYLMLKCPNCGTENAVSKQKCDSCGFGLVELKRNFRTSGKFLI
ncbi:MAG: zinc ribbon domain-containing protein [Acidobacteriaceae bacterium]|nr:zinc ribbon domain-containing protein [Acidobacteriaceae bacterium]MBV9778904.1 zinc ribbon domain-containing protein [Acidobacteriaceae bacterium]